MKGTTRRIVSIAAAIALSLSLVTTPLGAGSVRADAGFSISGNVVGSAGNLDGISVSACTLTGSFCSGSGRSAIPALRPAGVDTLVTGELREEHFNRVQEEKLNLYVCGHYATEVHGVKALAAELANKFRMPWEFIATENPF